MSDLVHALAEASPLVVAVFGFFGLGYAFQNLAEVVKAWRNDEHVP